SSKHHSDKPDKGSGGGGSSSQGGGPLSTNSGVGSGRAASLSPAAIPTTLIIKPPQDHTGGSGKEPLSKEAIAKMSTSSNFTETIVVNSESVYNHAGSGSGNAGSTSVIESGKLAMGGSAAGSGGSGSSYGGSTGPTGGSSTGSSSSSSGGKKRKADARSTPTSSVSSSEMLDANRDLIRDVAVSLVPLSLSKNDHIDPSSIAAHEKSVKKAKTETSSPLPHPATALPAPEPNLQNVAPNLIQSAHTSSIVSSASSSSASSSSSSSSSGKHQQQQQQHHHHQVS
uniref:Uncharacterized protein n=1 Tax=Anopheles melas TaxID=34690 RepID=A0A182TH80_9DIPT